jgi:hypothetical protein
MRVSADLDAMFAQQKLPEARASGSFSRRNLQAPLSNPRLLMTCHYRATME